MRKHRIAKRWHPRYGWIVITRHDAGRGDVYWSVDPFAWRGSLQAAKNDVDSQLPAADGASAWEEIQQPEVLSEGVKRTVAACFLQFADDFRSGADHTHSLESLQREYYGRSFVLVDAFDEEADQQAAFARLDAELRNEIEAFYWPGWPIPN